MIISPKILGLFISILALNNIINFTPYTSPYIYVGSMLLVLTFALLNTKHKFDGISLVFAGICFISIFFNDIPPLFKPNERFAMFLAVLLVVSPIIKGQYMDTVRYHIFRISSLLIIGLTVLSFLLKIIGIYDGLDYASNFGGLTINSMTLSPLAGLSLVLSVYQLKTSQSKKKVKMIHWGIISISFVTLILSASRIALASTIIAVLFLLSKFYNKRVGKYLRILFSLTVVLMVTYPFWNAYTENIERKIVNQELTGSQLSSREDLWMYRLEEFSRSPIIGIGFAHSLHGKIDFDTGTIEPGTSWGAIMAMTGTLGLIFFIVIVFRAYRNNNDTYKTNNLPISHLLNALLIFFIFHWIAEGYMLAAGSYLFFYAWLILGISSVNQQGYQIELV